MQRECRQKGTEVGCATFNRQGLTELRGLDLEAFTGTKDPVACRWWA